MTGDAAFERVYTVTDYYDGPREGIADFRGQPHRYLSVGWRTPAWVSGDERFELRSLSPDALVLELEHWAIWRRWEQAFHVGRTDNSTHPALPADRARFEAIAAELARVHEPDTALVYIAVGEFRVVKPLPDLPPGVVRPLEVRWCSVAPGQRAV